MRRDPRSYLWDVEDGAAAIGQFTADKTLDDHLADRLLRSAVERQFEIIGEALSQLSKVAPQIAQRVPELSAIVGFRNILIHGYTAVNHPIVWKTIQQDLPPLRARAAQLLDELGPNSELDA